MHTTKLLDLNGKDDSVWAVMRDGTAVWLSRECFKNLHKHDPLVFDKHRESACIDKRAPLIGTELRDARHFPKLRQEITGIKDNLRRLAHSRGYTLGSSAITMGWMLFSMCCKRRRRRERRKKRKGKWRLYLNNGGYHYEKWSRADLLRRPGWVGNGGLGSAAAAAHSSFFYLSAILPTHFNSHSSLERPLRCNSHLLWFVF